MEVIKVLSRLLLYVFILDIVTSLYVYWPKGQKPEQVPSDKTIWTWKETVWLVIVLLSIGLVLSIPIVFPVYKEKWGVWYAIIFLGSSILRQLNNIIPSAQTIGMIITQNDSTNLNPRENFAIILFASIVVFMNSYNVTERILIYSNKYTNPILGDCLLSLVYFFSIFAHVFFICALLIVPIDRFVHLLHRTLFSKNRSHNIYNRLKQKVDSELSTKTLIVLFIQYWIKKKTLIKLVLWPVAIPVFILDIIIQLFKYVTNLMFISAWYLLSLLRQLYAIIKKICLFFVNLSGKQVVALSFRVSIILGLVITVAINRYRPFYRMQEESTSILEFVSSTIVIPVIFEWIISYKNMKKGKSV